MHTRIAPDELITMYAEPVKRGAARLDDLEPGWRAHINVDTLDMRTDCIAMQATESHNFLVAIRMLNIRLPQDECAYGFEINLGAVPTFDALTPEGDLPQQVIDHYEALRQAWLIELSQNEDVRT